MDLLHTLLNTGPWVVVMTALLALLAYRIAPDQHRLFAFVCILYGLALAVEKTTFLLEGPLTQELRFVRELCQFLQGLAVITLLIAVLFGAMARIGWGAPRILQDVTVSVCCVLWGLWWLNAHGVNLAGLIATSAVLTAIVGLSMQDTLGNILGGLAIQLDTSVRKGDWIKVDDVVGRIVDVGWRCTEVETRNWETVLIPNLTLVRNKIVVLGRRIGQPLQWRRWVYFNVDFRFAPNQVIDTVENALRRAHIPNVAEDPPPNCVQMDFAESYCRYAVRYWLTDLALDDPTDSEVRTHIFTALQRHDIKLSLPAHAVFMTEETEERKASKVMGRISNRVRLLSSVKLFEGMSQDELEFLARHLKHAPFAEGEMITRQGTEAHWLYIIVRGTADVMVQAADGTTLPLSELGPGMHFGEWSLLTGQKRHSTVVARTDVDCYRLDREAFSVLLEKRPGIAEEVSKAIAEKRAAIESVLAEHDHQAATMHLKTMQADILSKVKELFGLK